MDIEHTEHLSIAIVGRACRFPGAHDVDQFWQNLRGGVESITHFDDAALEAAGVAPELLEDPRYIKAAPVLEDIDRFDAGFFGYSPREAALLDPQQRLFLEISWSALEDAGYDPHRFPGPIGVFAGTNTASYLLFNLFSRNQFVASGDTLEMLLGNEKDYLATRVSYKCDLKGPSVSVQSACSTSLVAVHMASRALLDYQCDMALAGCVSVRVPQAAGYLAEDTMIFSPDGHCRTFDAGGQGTLFGSGVGAVVLKRLEDALADGDSIRAVVRGSAVNNDGAAKVGYTAPSQSSQAEVVLAAQQNAEIGADTIDMVEAHGTATPLGDPIEIAALTEAFRASTERRGYCAIGSVKTNVGHLDTAAGMAGLIKTIESLQHAEMPPSLHFDSPNPNIDFDSSPFFVNTELRPWDKNGHPRRAGVSSFGMGGTNAHAILEEAPAPAESGPSRPVQLWLLSAKSHASLKARATDLAHHCRAHPELPAGDVAFTLAAGRQAFSHRLILVGRDLDEVAGRLDPLDAEHIQTATAQTTDRPVAMMFSGQGAQRVGMGRDLYRTERVFREAIDRCAELLQPHLGRDLRELIFADGDLDAATETLRQTRWAQPALFAVEYALAEQWKAWGVVPRALIGHSIGEYTAACLAGVFSLPDALALVAARGALMQELPSGAMAAVSLAAADIEPLLVDGLDLAVINGPELCAVAGPDAVLEPWLDARRAEGVDCKRLHTSHAFHSAMMEPIVERFEALVATVERRAPELPFISNVTGTWIEPDEATDPSYWSRHLRGTVRFADGVAELSKEPDLVLLEVGPGQSLVALARRAEGHRGRAIVGSMPRHDVDTDGQEHLLGALGHLWLHGVTPSWEGYFADETRRRVPLPTYPFDRRRYWIQATVDSDAAAQPLVVESDAGPDEDAALDFVAPRNAIEEAVAEVWRELLGLQTIGVHDNFFELGGHSLLASRVATKLRSQMQVDLPLAELFAKPTIAGLAAQLDGSADGDESDPAAGLPLELPTVVPDLENRHEPFPLTEMQQAQWIGRIGAFDIGDVAAHVYLETDSETLDLDRLQDSWRRMIQRHEMLRAVILPEGNQRILAEVPDFEIDVEDLRDLEADAVEARLDARREELSHQLRPVESWPLFGVYASLLPNGTTRIHLSFELLISDIASLRILLREWSRIYADPDLELEPLELSYRDYVLTEVQLRDSEPYRRSLDYWQRRLEDLPPAPELPLAQDPSTITAPHFKRWATRVDAADWQRIKDRCAAFGLSHSAVLLAAYAQALGRWSKSPRFSINMTIINRMPLHPQVGQVVGEFASFAPAAVDLADRPSFEELARRLQQQSWDDLENRYTHGVRILRELARAQGGTSGATMPVVFTSTLIHAHDRDQPLPIDWLGEAVYMISQTPQVWLDHSVFEDAGDLVLSWHALENLFPPAMVDEMWDGYCRQIHAVAHDEAAWTTSFDLMPARQLELRSAINHTDAPPPEGLLHGPFYAQAAAEPDRPAVIGDETTLTYGELRVLANRIGHRLRRLGARPNQLVAVVMDKAWQQVPAVFGILTSGAAYLPIDPELPEERLHYLLENGEVSIVLTQERWAAELSWPEGLEILAVDADTAADESPEDLPAVQRPTDLAYVIFTSGSTGKPKGVMIAHHAALNTVVDVNARFGIGPDDRVLAVAALNFDLSVYDLFGLLATGGALVTAPAAGRRDPAQWCDLVVRHRVTIWNSVPSLVEMLVEYASGRDLEPLPLRLVLMSGDWIPVDLPSRLGDVIDGVEIISLGGATEASIWSILFPIDAVDPDWASIPYGRPMVNQRFHVLDEALDPCPTWVPGGLYIAGVGLAEGYWRDEEKTAASFFEHPRTGERLYRTGDLGRYLPSGDIEFMGREDFQVKVLGHRIELGEIEAALVEHPRVRRTVVDAIGEQMASKRLAAYVVPDGELCLDELKAFVAAKLPAYMVPADFVQLDALPLTANGKVDRKRLPAPDRVSTTSALSDLGADAQDLADIFTSILGLDGVDVHQNFFEMGGDSIMGIQAVNRANEIGFEITPQMLFEYQTIAELAAAIKPRAKRDIDQSPVTGEAPFAPAQRHWLATTSADELGGKIDLLEVELVPAVDPKCLETAWQQVVAHHDVLRLRLHLDDEDERQIHAPIGESAPIRLVEAPAAGDSGKLDDEPLEAMRAALLEPFAEGAELVRAALWRGASGDRLIVAAHSMLLDAASWRWILVDLLATCRGLEQGEAPALPPKTDAFKDWSTALDAIVARRPDRPRRLATLLPVTESDGSERLVTADLRLPRETSEPLRGKALDAYNNRPIEILLAALVDAIAPWTGSRILSLDLAASARAATPDLDVARTVGPFEVPTALTLDLQQRTGHREMLQAVKEQTRQIVPLPVASAAQVAFSYRPRPELDAETGGSADRVLRGPVPCAPGDHLLRVDAFDETDGLHLRLSYRADQIPTSTVDGVLARLDQAVHDIVEHCLDPEAGAFTPSDFPEADMEQDDIDRFMATLAGN